MPASLPAFALLMLIALAPAYGQTTRPAPAVVGALADVVQATTARDVDRLRQLLADDYVFVNVDGSVLDRQQRLAQIESSQLRLAKPPREQQVTGAGDVRVVSSVYEAGGEIADPLSRGLYRTLDTFVLRDGQWQAIAGSVTYIAPAPAVAGSGPPQQQPLDLGNAVRQSRALYKRAVDAENNGDHAAAVAHYEAIGRLPAEAWPGDLQLRLRRAREHAK